MLDKEKLVLSQVRFERAEDCLQIAKQLLDLGHYKSATNRLYYAVFHAMRAVLALDGIDMKHHSGVISEFRRLYVKTHLFEAKASRVISDLSTARTDSDYDDFFIIEKAQVVQYVSDAEYFVGAIKDYLAAKLTV